MYHTPAGRNPVAEARESLYVRFNVRQRAWIQRQKLRGNGENARDGFGMKGNRTDNQCRLKVSDLLECVEPPAIADGRKMSDRSHVSTPWGDCDQISNCA